LFIAVMIETVPCRTYSNSRRAWTCGCLRDLAWLPFFSSTPVSMVPGGLTADAMVDWRPWLALAATHLMAHGDTLVRDAVLV
jgi:hypothetical protein